jgi:hypothetical protein
MKSDPRLNTTRLMGVSACRAANRSKIKVVDVSAISGLVTA